MRLDRRRALFVAAAVAFLAVTFRPIVTGDGVGYYVYLHSVIVDHDLNMSDEYAAARFAHLNISGAVQSRTATGLPPDQYPVGPAMLSVPAYLVALALHPDGEPQFGFPFTLAFTLSSLLFGLLALALVYRLVRRLGHSQSTSLVVVGAMALSTPLLYYLVFAPSYSHTFSAFMCTSFVYVWWTRRDNRTVAGWLVLGLIAGVMALVRWQDGALASIALLDLSRARWRILLMAPGALLAFSPQLAVDEAIYGRLAPGPPLVLFSPLPGHYWDVLFSSLHGLFTWSPVFLLAFAGYWFVKPATLRLAFAAAFLIQLAIVGSFVYWYAGNSFGMRFFIDLTPFWAIGLAALFARLRMAVSTIALAVLSAWNLVLVVSYTYLLKPDVAQGYRFLLESQLRALPYLGHLAQGYVARSLADPFLGRRADVPGALAVVLLEAAIVIVAVLAGSAGARDGDLALRSSQ